MIAVLTISLMSVGAQVSEEIGRVVISNDFTDPVPLTSKETVKIKGDVKIDGNPEIKLDGDPKIKFESVEKPVKVPFEKTEAMSETGNFKDGKNYNKSFDPKIMQRCKVDKISRTRKFCK